MSTNCKFYKEEEYVSYDSGITWTAMGVYRKGDLIEYDSEDCGYVPPTPTGNTKFSASYSGGETYSVDCDSDTTLTRSTTKPSGYNYSAMTSCEIGNCITSIGEEAFSFCSGLTNIAIGSGVTSIGDFAFWYCVSLPHITIPNSVISIEHGAFSQCSGLTSVTIGNGVTSIGQTAFDGCHNLKRINSDTDGLANIPNGVVSIGQQSFSSCRSLTSLIIPNSVTSIGQTAFNWCSGLTSVSIGTSVTSIGQFAFNHCSSLPSVTIPNSVTSIDVAAFQECSGLTSITCLATTPPSLGNNAFNKTNNCPIYVPSASVSAYQSAWSTYASRIQAIP